MTTISRLCHNCNTLRSAENSNFCSQTCFDEWIGNITAKAIAESVLAGSQIHNELATILIHSQLRRES